MSHARVDRPWTLGLVGLAVVLTACSEGESPGESAPRSNRPTGPLSVFVVNYPLKYFAERIGGEQVRVEFPAPAGVDPAFWAPDAATVAAYQQADLILLNGATYAKWVDRASLPQGKLVDTSRSFRDRYLAVEVAVTHRHGPQGEHAHADTAFTTWLDPKLALKQARAITEAFRRLRPDQQAAFAGYETLARDLGDLDEAIAATVARNREAPIVFSHPVYQYLARRYGLNARSVHWEPDAVPDAAEWRAFAELLSGHRARWMIWEGPPAPESRRRLEALGVRSVVFAPCANAPEAGDFLSVMRQNVEALARVFDEPAG